MTYFDPFILKVICFKSKRSEHRKTWLIYILFDRTNLIASSATQDSWRCLQKIKIRHQVTNQISTMNMMTMMSEDLYVGDEYVNF